VAVVGKSRSREAAITLGEQQMVRIQDLTDSPSKHHSMNSFRGANNLDVSATDQILKCRSKESQTPSKGANDGVASDG
jgi:hypothetical protein